MADGLRIYVGSREVAANRDWFAAAERLPLPPDTLDVVAHGNFHKIAIHDANPVGAATFAGWLRRRLPLARFRTVRLLCCSTGCLDDGFAARLCEQLRIPVLAPRIPVLVCNGQIDHPRMKFPKDYGLPAGYDLKNPPAMRLFTPGEPDGPD